jgi:hypothetical protein
MDKSLSLGMPISPQEISKKYKRQSLGMPPRPPLLHHQKLGHLSRHYIFYCFMHYAFFLERQLFLFSVFFCFVCCNKWLDHIMFLLEEMNSLFICQEHSSFHSYRLNEFSLFLLLCLACIFCLDFCSDLVLSLHQGVFGPLVYVGFYQKSCLKKV